MLFALACSIQPTSILKGSCRRGYRFLHWVRWPVRGSTPGSPQMERCWPWSGLRSLAVPNPSYTKRLVIAIISAAFALFSQMFYVVAAFHTENPPVLITYPQLSVFTALSLFNAIFFTGFTPVYSCTCFAFPMALSDNLMWLMMYPEYADIGPIMIWWSFSENV